jgi:hypothetical protein
VTPVLVSLLFISQQGLGHIFSDRPLLLIVQILLHLYSGVANFKMLGSGNDKNKQITFLSQHKLVLQEEICKWLCKFGVTNLQQGATLIQAYINVVKAQYSS